MQDDRQTGAVHKRQRGQVEHQLFTRKQHQQILGLLDRLPCCMMVQFTGVHRDQRALLPSLRDLQHICHLEISKILPLISHGTPPCDIPNKIPIENN